MNKLLYAFAATALLASGCATYEYDRVHSYGAPCAMATTTSGYRNYEPVSSYGTTTYVAAPVTSVGTTTIVDTYYDDYPYYYYGRHHAPYLAPYYRHGGHDYRPGKPAHGGRPNARPVVSKPSHAARPVVAQPMSKPPASRPATTKPTTRPVATKPAATTPARRVPTSIKATPSGNPRTRPASRGNGGGSKRHR